MAVWYTRHTDNGTFKFRQIKSLANGIGKYYAAKQRLINYASITPAMAGSISRKQKRLLQGRRNERVRKWMQEQGNL